MKKGVSLLIVVIIGVGGALLVSPETGAATINSAQRIITDFGHGLKNAISWFPAEQIVQLIAFVPLLRLS